MSLDHPIEKANLVDEPYYKIQLKAELRIDHFTVLCLVTWPLNGSEAGGDLA